MFHIRVLATLLLLAFALSVLGAERYSHADKKKPVFSFLSKLKKQNQLLKRKLLQHKLMLVELYQKDRAQITKIKKLNRKIRELYGLFFRLKKRLEDQTKASHTSCFQLLNLFPNAKSGWHTIYRKKKPVRVFCDMKTAGGGWTRFIHHSDPNGRTPISQSVWDKGIQFAADGNIKQWLTKTYTNPHHNSEKKSKCTNTWTMTLATKVQGPEFVHFKFHKPVGCDNNRYRGTDYVSQTSLLPGSKCSALSERYKRYLYGEHKWCSNKKIGWLWMPQCKHRQALLVVNYQGQTHIGQAGEPDKDGGSFEFFYR